MEKPRQKRAPLLVLEAATAIHPIVFYGHDVSSASRTTSYEVSAGIFLQTNAAIIT
jgi:hypothetical protein